jgi:hypothetical protein
MSNTPQDGGPAWPQPVSVNGEGRYGYTGMTLRDWFAGQALGGFLADYTIQCGPGDAAKSAYQYADAMIAERAKSRTP